MNENTGGWLGVLLFRFRNLGNLITKSCRNDRIEAQPYANGQKKGLNGFDI